jgi:hypothetical protein
MKFKDGLIAARSHIIFIIVLCVLFSVLQYFDRAEGIDSQPAETELLDY